MDNELNLILKGTSRAFYLSLAVLPGAAREPLSLGYLLARAADTLADAPAAGAFDRADALKQLRSALLDDGLDGWSAPTLLQPELAKERELLASVPRLGRLLREREPSQRKAIVEVVSTLIEGMIWDQLTFASPRPQGLTQHELETYTYLVAGCVGPFWSRVCAASDPRLVHLADPLIDETAVEFGKGLQWVNILRDAPKDQLVGRHYLPNLQTPGYRLALTGHARRAVAALSRATAYPALFPFTALSHRLAVFLPLVLGFRTLELLFRQGGPRPGRRVKVARGEVLLWLAFGPILVASRRGMSFVLGQLRRRVEKARTVLEDHNETDSF